MEHSIIVDLDGTLCDSSHRNHLAQAGQWDEFHRLCKDDQPNEDVVALLQRFASSDEPYPVRVVAITGRNEHWRKVTTSWLLYHQIAHLIDEIHMRPDGDFQPDIELKIGIILKAFGSIENARKEILFCLDDRDKVVTGFRDVGLNCWQVREGAF
jgi:hypothetical protein